MSQDFQARFIQSGKAIDYTPASDVAAGAVVVVGAHDATHTAVFYDYEDVHGGAGEAGSRNFVYVDGHVGSSHGPPPDETDNTP